MNSVCLTCDKRVTIALSAPVVHSIQHSETSGARGACSCGTSEAVA